MKKSGTFDLPDREPGDHSLWKRRSEIKQELGHDCGPRCPQDISREGLEEDIEDGVVRK